MRPKGQGVTVEKNPANFKIIKALSSIVERAQGFRPINAFSLMRPHHIELIRESRRRLHHDILNQSRAESRNYECDSVRS